MALRSPATPEAEASGLGCFPFARRYLGNRCFFLFLRVLRCFSSPGCLHTPMDSACDTWILLHVGCPIRISPDRSLLAALRSFSQLTASFVDSWHQGIHRTLLSSLPLLISVGGIGFAWLCRVFAQSLTYFHIRSLLHLDAPCPACLCRLRSFCLHGSAVSLTVSEPQIF